MTTTITSDKITQYVRAVEHFKATIATQAKEIEDLKGEVARERTARERAETELQKCADSVQALEDALEG